MLSHLFGAGTLTSAKDLGKDTSLDTNRNLMVDNNLPRPGGSEVGSPFKMSQEGTPSSACGVCKTLWDGSQDLVMRSLYSPFVLALGQGVLPREAFQAYVGQDAHFLRGFAEAYQAALSRCGAGEEGLRLSLESLLRGVEDELQLHESYAKEWGVNLSDHTQPNSTTKQYLDYVHAIANDPKESIGSILSALVPCLRLYAFLGCTLARALPEAEHPYTEWVATYSSADYLSLPDTAETLLDQTAKDEPFEKLLRQYRGAMALEADFFAAQPFAPPPRRISLLVTDFDDTCSASDTIGLICQTAIAAAVKQAGDGEFAEQLRQDLEATLRELVINYSTRRNALLEESLPEVDEPPEEFDMGWLGDFIDRISEFDREMNQVVVDSGILGGIKRGALSDVGSTIPMQPGCLELLQKAVEAGIPTCTISVNWSAEMVRASLAQRGLPVVLADPDAGTALQEGSVVVYANELEYFGDQSTGSIKRKVECAADKGHVFDELLLNVAIEGGADGITVFVGDSMTDIPALISADVGILLGSNPLVQQVALAAGIELLPLVAAPLDAQQQDHSQCTLYEASSWQEIESFLFNSQFQAPPRKEPRRVSSNREAEQVTLGGKVPRVLAIAGSDSGGGAGIQADTKTCSALGVFAANAVTALTAQNTQGVDAVHVAPVDFLRKQISAVLGDIGADVVKTGMLPTPEVVEAVADELQKQAVGCLVVDPVLVATSGDALATQGVVEAIQTHLLPIATVVTPNIPEASALLGGKQITDLEDMRHAARALHQFGPQWVLLKGGHLAQGAAGDPQGGEVLVTDILFDGRNMMEMSSPYIKSGNLHGTGCTLASAVAAELAKGRDVPCAVRRARRYLWRVVERSVDLPIGKGVQKPMNHNFRAADWAAELHAAAAAAAAAAEPGLLQGGRPPRIPNPCDLRVYAVTDPDCNEQWGRGNAEAVRLALDGGATIVQLREKKCDGGYFAQQAAAVLEVCRARKVPLLINDRVDVALAVDADGVHVGQDDIPAAIVRRIIGPDKLLGVSVKTVEEALRAEADGADYLGAGAVFPTGTKESDVIGLDRLAEICQAVKIPVVSIGGVKASNAGDTVAAGAAGAAIVSGIFAAENPADAAREFKRVVDEALQQRGQ